MFVPFILISRCPFMPSDKKLWFWVNYLFCPAHFWYVLMLGLSQTVLVLVNSDLRMDHGVTMNKFLPKVLVKCDLRRFCSPRPPAKENILGQAWGVVPILGEISQYLLLQFGHLYIHLSSMPAHCQISEVSSASREEQDDLLHAWTESSGENQLLWHDESATEAFRCSLFNLRASLLEWRRAPQGQNHLEGTSSCSSFLSCQIQQILWERHDTFGKHCWDMQSF